MPTRATGAGRAAIRAADLPRDPARTPAARRCWRRRRADVLLTSARPVRGRPARCRPRLAHRLPRARGRDASPSAGSRRARRWRRRSTRASSPPRSPPPGVPLLSYLPLGVWGRRDGSPVLEANPANAKRLLAEAGFPRGTSAGLLDQRRRPAARSGAGGRGDPRLAGHRRHRRPASRSSRRRRRSSSPAPVSTRWRCSEARVEAGDPHFLLYPLSSTEGASKGPGAVEHVLLPQPRARRSPRPREPGLLPSRAPASLCAGAEHHGRGGALGPALRAACTGPRCVPRSATCACTRAAIPGSIASGSIRPPRRRRPPRAAGDDGPPRLLPSALSRCWPSVVPAGPPRAASPRGTLRAVFTSDPPTLDPAQAPTPPRPRSCGRSSTPWWSWTSGSSPSPGSPSGGRSPPISGPTPSRSARA